MKINMWDKVAWEHNFDNIVYVTKRSQIVPQMAIIGSSDDTSNKIVLNNTQHGSETFFVDIGNNTRIRTPFAGTTLYNSGFEHRTHLY